MTDDRADLTASTPRQRRGARELRIIEQFEEQPLNYSAPDDPQQARLEGWRVDSSRTELTAEVPGEPTPGGPWERAVQIAREYRFVDPAIVRAVWRTDAPLEGRTMALRGRFLFLHFWLGVRVTSVTDETRSVDGRQARVFTYAYQTLAFHLETGELFYEVWKWLDSGEVEWRIHSVSRAARITNPIVRIGFRIFGRRVQLRFVRNANSRMAAMVAADD